MSTRMRQLCYNSLMLIVATASFAAFGGIDSIIEHTVVVSPNKAKNKAFRMEAGSAVCDLYLTPESPWAIRDSRITGRDDKTLWKKIDKAHYFMAYGYAVNEYVKIDGDLYKSGTGTGGAGTPEYPPFSVTVPKVDLQWGEKHGDASKEEKEDDTPVVLVVSESKNLFGRLLVHPPKDDLSIETRKCRVTLLWSPADAVKVFKDGTEIGTKTAFDFDSSDAKPIELDVCAVKSAVDVKFTLEGEPDNVNKDRAVDYVHACCAKIEFVTPAGDPVRSPKDSGDGQNEFTFSSANPGILTMNLKARVAPVQAADKVADGCVFSVDPIGASVMKWANGNPGGKAVADNGFLKATVMFTGLPAKNSDFGKKKAAISFKGVVCDEKEYEVFFPKFGTNHPRKNVTERTANWFYYWKDGDVCGIPNDATYGPISMVVEFEDGEILPMSLCDFDAKENSRVRFDSHTVEFGVEEAGGNGRGIQCIAEVVQHEMHHKYLAEKYSGACKVKGDDIDGDGIPNTAEGTEDGVRTSPTNPDTYRVASVFPDVGGYEKYGDDEIRCRKCEMILLIPIFPERDWANPGCQSKVPYGPCPILR